jgi:hypothetical protein
MASAFKGLFSVMTRNKSGVVIEGHVALPSKPVEHGQKTRMFLVNPCPDKFDDRDALAGSWRGTRG